MLYHGNKQMVPEKVSLSLHFVYLLSQFFLFLLLVQNTTIKIINFIDGRGCIYTIEPDFNI